MRESAGATPACSEARTPTIARERMRWPSQRMGLTFRPWRRSRAKRGWQTIAAIPSESAYSPKVAAGVRGRCRARRTPAGTPGPTGAKKSARTSATGPPGKCCAAWRSLAAPACPAYRVGSSAADGSKTSKGLIGRDGDDHPATGSRIRSRRPQPRTTWGTGRDHSCDARQPQRSQESPPAFVGPIRPQGSRRRARGRTKGIVVCLRGIPERG